MEATTAGSGDTAERGHELRQLTIVYCDLVGSSSLLERLGVERYRRIQVAFLRHCEACALEAGAEKVRFLGDALAFLFGRVQAFEYDAERAIRLALALAGSVRRLRPDGHAVSGHFSIATGTFMVQARGEGAGGPRDASADYELVGEALNVGARLLSLAGRDAVVVSDLSRRLASGLFEYRDLGPHALKGFAHPIRAWEVLGETHVESRFYAMRASALTEVVGRGAERERLAQLWDSVKDGAGRVVLLAGESGIGKSRLVQILTDEIVDAYSQRSSFYCHPHTRGSSLEPVAHYLRSACGFEVDDSDADRLEKLGALLTGTLAQPEEAVPLVASILMKHHEAALSLSAQALRERRLEILSEHLCGLSPLGPSLIVVEDVHWADAGTLALLERLIAGVATRPILLVLTFRPEERDDEPFRRVTQSREPQVDCMALGPLDDAQSARLVELVFGEVTPPPGLTERIVARTDGNPLFIEDVSRHALEVGEEVGRASPGGGPGVPRAVPGVLWDALMGRLDRLGRAKYLAQVAAVIGREFSPSLLATVADVSGDTLDSALRQLAEARILVPPARESHPYSFRHALVRDTAYHSLPAQTRSELHGRVAEVLEVQHPAVRRLHPELLAQHAELAADLDLDARRQGGRLLRAAALWLEAGDLSADRSEFDEALERLFRALDILQRVRPASGMQRERDRLELEVRTEIARVQCVYRGYSAPEVREALDGAFALCKHIGDAEAIFDLYMINGGYHITYGNLEAARKSGLEALEAARARPTFDPRHLVIAHRSLVGVAFLTGDPLRAIAYADEAVGQYDAHEKDILRQDRRIVVDHKSMLLCYKQLALLAVGRTDEALRAGALGVEHADRLGHAHTRAFSRTVFTMLRYLLRDPLTRAQAEDVCLYTESQHFANLVGVIRMILGELLVAEGVAAGSEGTVERGIDTLRRGAEAHSGMEARTYRPFGLGLMSSATLRTGRHREATAILDAALAMVAETGERWYLPELLRLRGLCFWRQAQVEEGSPAAAREQLEAACAEAAAQGARFWALRSCTSLARLMRVQGENAAAVERLSAACEGFGEGASLPDLEDARQVLREAGA